MLAARDSGCGTAHKIYAVASVRDGAARDISCAFVFCNYAVVARNCAARDTQLTVFDIYAVVARNCAARDAQLVAFGAASVGMISYAHLAARNIAALDIDDSACYCIYAVAEATGSFDRAAIDIGCALFNKYAAVFARNRAAIDINCGLAALEIYAAAFARNGAAMDIKLAAHGKYAVAAARNRAFARDGQLAALLDMESIYAAAYGLATQINCDLLSDLKIVVSKIDILEQSDGIIFLIYRIISRLQALEALSSDLSHIVRSRRSRLCASACRNHIPAVLFGYTVCTLINKLRGVMAESAARDGGDITVFALDGAALDDGIAGIDIYANAARNIGIFRDLCLAHIDIYAVLRIRNIAARDIGLSPVAMEIYAPVAAPDIGIFRNIGCAVIA